MKSSPPTKTKKLSRCPKCDHKITDPIECKTCGIIFERYLQRQKRNQQDKAKSAISSPSQKNESFTHCPKCGAEKNDPVECKTCGIVFDKYFRWLSRSTVAKEDNGELSQTTTGKTYRQRWMLFIFFLITLSVSPYFYVKRDVYHQFFLDLYDQKNNNISNYVRWKKSAAIDLCEEMEGDNLTQQALQCYTDISQRAPKDMYVWCKITALLLRDGKPWQAEEAIGNVLRLGEQTNDQEKLYYAYHWLGHIYRYRDEHARAYLSAEKCLNSNIALGDERGTVYDYINLASFHYDREEWDEAYELLKKARSIIKHPRDVSEKKVMISVLANIGLIHRQRGDFDKSFDVQRKVLEMARTLGDKDLIANSLSHLARLYRDHEEYDNSIGLLDEALQHYQTIGEKQKVALTYEHLGITYKKLGDLNTARTMYNNALDIYNEINVFADIEDVQRLLSDLN